MKKPLLILSLLTILTISCAIPYPISQLSPSEKENLIWENGREIITQSKDSLTLEVSYYEKQDELFIFDVSIINQREEVITIDPLQFSYIPISSKGDTLNLVHAVNPENEILKQEMQISKLNAQKKNELRTALILGSLELATELTTENDEYSDDYPSAIEVYNYESDKIDYRKLNTFDKKAYWENQTLRKTTLFPDCYTSGQIFLKYKKDVKKIGLLFSIDDRTFEFWFNHSLKKHSDF